MPRDSAGTMTLPTGNPVVTGTTISPTVQNATMADVTAELTDSLSRSGKGGMLVPIPNTDGVASAPSITFNNEATTGLYRAGAGDLRVSLLGTAVMKWLKSGSSYFVDLLTNALKTDTVTPSSTSTSVTLLGNKGVGTGGADVVVNSGNQRTTGDYLFMVQN